MNEEEAKSFIEQKLRDALQGYIGKKPTMDELQAAASSVFEKMKLDYPIGQDVLRKAVEVAFGLTDPIELVDLLETKSTDEIQRYYETYGDGPGNLFAMVLMRRRGSLDWAITEHRPGFLEITVNFKEPLKWINVTLTLDKEGSDGSE